MSIVHADASIYYQCPCKSVFRSIDLFCKQVEYLFIYFMYSAQCTWHRHIWCKIRYLPILIHCNVCVHAGWTFEYLFLCFKVNDTWHWHICCNFKYLLILMHCDVYVEARWTFADVYFQGGRGAGWPFNTCQWMEGAQNMSSSFLLFWVTANIDHFFEWLKESNIYISCHN